MSKIKVGLIALGMLVPGVALGGAVGGPQGKRDTVLGNSSDNYVLVFEGRETARINVRGDGSSDLDCYVYDNKGGLVASDDDSTDVCVLVWTPAWTGKFKLKITNRGDNPNEYTVQTN